MEENKGWISLYRKTLENPYIMKDSDHLAIWCYLLLKATHKSYKSIFGKSKITLKKGQLIIGRKKIADDLGINESKIERVLKCFESEQQIEQQKNTKGRLITILNWGMYQNNEQQFEQQMNNKRTTSEQQMNTNNNVIIEQYNNVINNKDNKKNSERENKGNCVAPTHTLSSIIVYGKELGVNEEYCEKFFNHYESIGWVNGNGLEIKNWKLVFNNWVNKDKLVAKKEEPKKTWHIDKDENGNNIRVLR